MKVDGTNNVNFGSNFILARKLSEEEGNKLVEHFHMENPKSPFQVYRFPEEGINQVNSFFDKYDYLVEKFLGKMNIKIRKKNSSLNSLVRKIQQITDSTFPAKATARNYINETEWELPAKLLDK
ncbi:MAG: hypothetical protein WCY19_00505 [Candidatus Gastranaerophilaceae bacterium]